MIMKKILFISAAVLLLAACHKEPYPQDGDNEYLVYTSPGKDVNFSNFKTFDIADSLLVIGQGDKPVYSQSQSALALIQAYRTNMEKLGYIYTPSNPDADLGIQLTYIIKTERYVQYYDNPYWWLDYPGYWPPASQPVLRPMISTKVTLRRSYTLESRPISATEVAMNLAALP